MSTHDRPNIGYYPTSLGPPSYVQAPNISTIQSASLRRGIVQNCFWFVQNANNIYYKSDGNNLRMCRDYLSKPRQLQGLGGVNGIVTDCSGSIFICYKWAGIDTYLSSPTRRSRVRTSSGSFVPLDLTRQWESTGGFYTGTISQYFKKIQPRDALPGDILLWNGHAAIIVQRLGIGEYRYFNHGGPGFTDRPRFKEETKSNRRGGTFLGVYRWPGVT